MLIPRAWLQISFFFFNDTATTEIYTLSLHDALPIAGECTRDEVRTRGERNDQRVEYPHAGASGRELRIPIGLRGGRRLPFGHAVNVVIHHDVRHVDVAPARVEEMIAADRVTVAVAASGEHGEIGTCDLETGRRRERAAVHAVKAVARRVRGNPRRAADARYDSDLMRRHADHRERLRHRAQDRIVAAAGAPDRLVRRFECRVREWGRCADVVPAAGLIATSAFVMSPGRSGSGPGLWKLTTSRGRSKYARR